MKTTTTTPTPRPYGRQSKGKTIRSVSLKAELALWVDQQAVAENTNASKFVNTLLGRLRDRAIAKQICSPDNRPLKL